MVAWKARALRGDIHLMVPCGCGIGCCERGQRAQVRGDADGGEAGAGGLNAGDQGEQVVDGMGAPGVGVGAGVAGDLRPGAEVEGK